MFIGLLSVSVTHAQELVGPVIVTTGSLAAFEVVPVQEIAWNILPTADSKEWFQVDSSSGKLYFASPHEKEFTIVAAVVADGKPVLLAKTFFNGKRDTKPDDDTKPPTPQPDASLGTWIKTQLPLQVKSPNLSQERKAVAEALAQIIKQIDDGVIKTSQNAQAQIRISVTAALAKSSRQSVNAWQDFLSQLSVKIQAELGENTGELSETRKILQEIAKAIEPDAEAKSLHTPSSVNCPNCRSPEPLQQLFRFKR